MTRFLTLLRAFIAWLFGRQTVERPYKLAVVEGAFPGRLDDKTVYLLTEDGEPWQARMICPCGCRTELDLNMLPDERPCWEAWSDDHGRATLRPSVWRKIGCRSHFFVRAGTIVWCDDTSSSNY